jgi:hypothetical protein
MKLGNSEDLNRKFGSSHVKYPYQNRGKTSSRTHKKFGINSRKREKQRGGRPSRIGLKTGPGRSTQPFLGSVRAPL